MRALLFYFCRFSLMFFLSRTLLLAVGFFSASLLLSLVLLARLAFSFPFRILRIAFRLVSLADCSSLGSSLAELSFLSAPGCAGDGIA